MVMPRKPLDTDRFGRLTVEGPIKGGWSCICDCGNRLVVTGNHLREGRVQSCGCLHAERQREATRTHGRTGTPVYECWLHMRARCTNPNSPDWKNYGGRGIRICGRWSDFTNFLADMGEPGPGETLDRIQVNGDYEPGNCRWATKKVQARNTRSNRQITLDGETKPLAEWCEQLGLPYWTVHSRLRRGRTPEEALRP